MKELMKKIKSKYVGIMAFILCALALLQLAPVVRAETSSTQTIYDSTYIDKLVIDLKALIQSSNDDLKKQIGAISSQTDLQKQVTDMQKQLADAQKQLADSQKELSTLKDGMVFKIIKLPAGKTLIGEASTELIVRNKNRVRAYVASSASGGISNLISGTDIPNGVIVPANQLILVPKADGRGVTAISDADIMIKGTYTIK